jgi:hypothetical protein
MVIGSHVSIDGSRQKFYKIKYEGKDGQWAGNGYVISKQSASVYSEQTISGAVQEKGAQMIV